MQAAGRRSLTQKLEQPVRGRFCELRIVDVAIELDQRYAGSVASQRIQQRHPSRGVVERLPLAVAG
jgi:hypothetical protein